MPAIDLSLLPSVSPVIIEKTFTDPRCPGTQFPMRFGVMPFRSNADRLFFGDTFARIEQKYVKQNIPVRVQGGLIVPIEANLCAGVAACILAERLTGTESAWSPDEWFEFSVLAPDAWAEVQQWLIEKEREIRGVSVGDIMAEDEDKTNEEDQSSPNA